MKTVMARQRTVTHTPSDTSVFASILPDGKTYFWTFCGRLDSLIWKVVFEYTHVRPLVFQSDCSVRTDRPVGTYVACFNELVNNCLFLFYVNLLLLFLSGSLTENLLSRVIDITMDNINSKNTSYITFLLKFYRLNGLIKIGNTKLCHQLLNYKIGLFIHKYSCYNIMLQ